MSNEDRILETPVCNTTQFKGTLKWILPTVKLRVDIFKTVPTKPKYYSLHRRHWTLLGGPKQANDCI